MEPESFKPNHLLSNEITYELKIRGINTTRDINDKRKNLGRALTKEKGRTLVFIDPDYDYETEVTETKATLESIKNLIDEFEGSSPSDSTFLRARSRLAHVSSRILRMSLDVEATQEQKDYRNESYATCLHFEAELYEKISLNTTIQASSSNASSVTTPTVISVPIPTQTKTVAIYKWDLKFDGVPKQFEVESFIERVEELAKARGVSKEQLFNSAVDLFVGKRIDWWRYVKPSVNDWHSLTSRLKSDFLPKDYDENVWKIIKERKQNSNESVTIFIAELESYFRRLSNQPAEITKISWIKRNLNYQLYE